MQRSSTIGTSYENSGTLFHFWYGRRDKGIYIFSAADMKLKLGVSSQIFITLMLMLVGIHRVNLFYPLFHK